MLGGRILARAEPGSQPQQRLVAAARGGHLHASSGAWNGDYRNPCQAERRGVTQQTAARLAVIRARG